MGKSKVMVALVIISMLSSFASPLLGYAVEEPFVNVTGVEETSRENPEEIAQKQTGKKEARETQDIMQISAAYGYPANDFYRPAASMVIEADTGDIVWSDQPDLEHEIASITKLMSVYLIFEAISQKKITLDTSLTVSDKIAEIANISSLSNNRLIAGTNYKVSDLLSIILMASSNAATVMLTNFLVDDNEGKFVEMMNTKAKELGMNRTNFYNSSGATASAFNGLYNPEGFDAMSENTSTVHDLALLTYHLLKEYPEILEYTKKPVVTVMAGTEMEETFSTYVYSVEGSLFSLEGTDGLKTGSSPTAGFGHVGTTKRGDTRMIEVFLGVGDWTDPQSELVRFGIGNALMEKMFDDFSVKKVLKKGVRKINGKKIVLEKDLSGFVRTDKKPEFEFKGNQVVLKPEFKKISKGLKQPSVTYKKFLTAAQKAEIEHQRKVNKRIGQYIVPLLLLLVSAVFLTLAKIFQQKERSEAIACFMLGTLILAITLILTAYTLVTGQPFLYL